MRKPIMIIAIMKILSIYSENFSYMIEICEHESSNYAPRTKYNASIADVTIALAYDLETHGEILTKKCAGSKYIGFKIDDNTWTQDIVKDIFAFLTKRKAHSINIAGNGIYTLGRYDIDQKNINLFMYMVLERLCKNYCIEKIYTGGQTGVDLAGAVAGHALGIDVIMTLPKGFKQRFEDGVDVYQTKEAVEKQFAYWCEILKKAKK